MVEAFTLNLQKPSIYIFCILSVQFDDKKDIFRKTRIRICQFAQLFYQKDPSVHSWLFPSTTYYNREQIVWLLSLFQAEFFQIKLMN